MKIRKGQRLQPCTDSLCKAQHIQRANDISLDSLANIIFFNQRRGEKSIKLQTKKRPRHMHYDAYNMTWRNPNVHLINHNTGNFRQVSSKESGGKWKNSGVLKTRKHRLCRIQSQAWTQLWMAWPGHRWIQPNIYIYFFIAVKKFIQPKLKKKKLLEDSATITINEKKKKNTIQSRNKSP